MVDAPFLVPTSSVGEGSGCATHDATEGSSMVQSRVVQTEVAVIDHANGDPRIAAHNLALEYDYANGAPAGAQRLPPAEVIALVTIHFTLVGLGICALAQAQAELACDLLWVPCTVLAVLHVLLFIFAWYSIRLHLISNTKKVMCSIAVGVYLFITGAVAVVIFYMMLCG